MLLNIILYFLFFYFVANVVVKYFSFCFVEKYLNNRKKVNGITISEKFFIIIPVYEESEIVAQSVNYFSAMVKEQSNVKIVFVGTQRENPNKTKAEIQKCLSENNISDTCFYYEATKNYKYMAGQINYTIKEIDKTVKDYYFAVYNVDSRPDKSDVIANFTLLNDCSIVQQYGMYFNNFPSIRNRFIDYIYADTYLWQSSWTKQFEIRNILWNNFCKFRLLNKFSYVVGHGLYMKRSVLSEIGMFTEKYQNEDMEFSLRLHNHKIPITLGYGFSNSDMPVSLSDYIRQQTVWSRGPMLALNYNHINLNSVKLFLHYLYWLCEPIGLSILWILSLYYGIFYISMVVLLSCIYFYTVLILPNKHILSNQRLGMVFYLAAPLFFTIHSFGPFCAAYNKMLEQLKLKKEYKFKTPKGKIKS